RRANGRRRRMSRQPARPRRFTSSPRPAARRARGRSTCRCPPHTPDCARNFRETSMLQRSARVLGMGLVLLLIAWGARVTFLEGFYLKWPDFHGDFTAVMFTDRYWLGHRGIPYGPFFVIESYYVTRWPDVFTPVFFALANIPLA